MRKITYNNFYEGAGAGAENTEDLSLLGLPMRGPFAGFQEAKKAYDNGTNEVRRLLMDECNLIYECNVCRSMFRCFNNFINHKRSFCRENASCIPNGCGDHNSVIIIDESSKSKDNQPASPSIAVVATANSCNSQQVPVIIESGATMNNSQGHTAPATITNNNSNSNTTTTTVLQLEPVPNSTQAVYQTIKREQEDTIKAEVDELTKMLSNIGTTLGPDGKAMPVAEPNTEPITDAATFKCDTCEAAFHTEKTLQIHKQKLHASPSSLVFQCPACPQTYMQPAALMKHLASEHKKPVRRIRMMRETMKRRIQMGNVASKQKSKMGARELKRLHVTDDVLEHGDNNTMLSDEGDGGGGVTAIQVKKIMSSCIYCDKSFERRAALSTHLLNCRAKQEARIGPSVIVKNEEAAVDAEIEQPQVQQHFKEETGSALEMQQQHQQASELIDEMLPIDYQQMNLNESEGPHEMLTSASDEPSIGPIKQEQLVKSEFGAEQEPTPAAGGGVIMKRKSPPSAVVEKTPNGKTKTKKKKRDQLDESAAATPTPNASSTPNETAAVPCRCKICHKQFNALSNLRRHISMFHYRAQRFGCKLCNYRGFRRYDIVNHLGFVHKMTGERDAMSVEYVSVHEVEYSKDDVDADILLLQGAVQENEETTPLLTKSHTEKSKVKRSNKSRPASELQENAAPAAAAVVESKALPSTRKSLRRSQSQQENENGTTKRPIRNRVKAVNKDFVYDLLKTNKDTAVANETSQTSAASTTTTTTSLNTSNTTQSTPTTTTTTKTNTTTRTLRRRNTTNNTNVAVERDNDTSCSSSSNSSCTGNRDELTKLHVLLTPSKRIASKGSALRLAMDLVQHGKAKSSTPPELPAERRQWRPRLSSTSREDMQAGPVIDTTDLEAARRKATPLLDDSFLEKMAKRSTTGAFRLKPCLATQHEHSALDSLLQKVDSMQQQIMKSATPVDDDMNTTTTTTSGTLTEPPTTPSSQLVPEAIKQEPLIHAGHKEEVGNFSSYFQTPPPPAFPYQTSHYINAHNSPDSPTMATVSDFEDETDDDEYEHSSGVIGSLMYPNGHFYDLQQQQQQQQLHHPQQQHHHQQHHQHHQHHHLEAVQTTLQPPMPSNHMEANKPSLTTLMQHLAEPSAHVGNSLLRSALEH